ncbi:aldose 1-epimerase [Thalassospira sp.]|uniref:aldose epimerase family protein n=1 Tax=Thalassospira sp. TaxID=1912094 RepID=UPI0032EB98A7
MSKKGEPEYRWNSGPFQIGIVPQGGAISRIDWVRPDGNGVINLLRPVSEQALNSGNPSSLGCFPMVPFANRLAFSEFDFDGHIVKVPANRPPSPHAIHGFGRGAEWKIERPTVDRLRFNHKHDDAKSGFVYVAWQEFKVTEIDVTLEIGVRHLGRTPMPYGIGLHPWFPGGEDASVSFVASDCFATDEDMLPTRRTVIDLGRDFSDGKMIRHHHGLDVHYTGWEREAEMIWDEAGYSLHMTASDTMSNLQFYIPEDGKTFCVEPVTHVPNVHNHPEFKEFGDLVVLDNNQTLTGSMTLTPSLLAKPESGLVDDDDIAVPAKRDYSLVD